MRKTGFTLAEVLITLAIIGVVASITIPALKKNIDQADNIVRLKKTASVLSQSMKRLASDNGGSLKGVATNGEVFSNNLSKYINFTKQCHYTQVYGNCWQSSNNYYNKHNTPQSWGNSYGAIVNDGQFLIFGFTNANCDVAVDGVNVCVEFYSDVNGFKGPNTVGKDIFRFHVLANGQVMPCGYFGDNRNMNKCLTDGEDGFECTAYYLTGR